MITWFLNQVVRFAKLFWDKFLDLLARETATDLLDKVKPLPPAQPAE